MSNDLKSTCKYLRNFQNTFSIDLVAFWNQEIKEYDILFCL